MSTRRSSRKKIDYSQFDDGKADSDDDFQDSPNAPPTKKAKTTAKREENKKNETKKKEIKETKIFKTREESKHAQISIHGSIMHTDQNMNSRRSRDEKLFERELQAVIQLSKKQSPQVINIDEDDAGSVSVENTQQTSYERIKETAVGLSLHSNENEEKDDESEYEASEGELDESNDDDEDEDEDDDDFNVESDDEFKISPKKSKKVKEMKTTGKVKGKLKNVSSNIAISAKRDVIAKTKIAMQPTAAKISSSTLEASTPKIRSNACAKRGLKPSSGSLARVCPSQTNTGYTPLRTPSTNGSPSLDGVTVKSSGHSGLRLGLSRNVRVSKPLHSNIRLKTS